MTTGPGGVGGTEGPEQTEMTPLMTPEEARTAKAFSTPVSTLGDLKQVLIDQLGEKKGTQLYNTWIQSTITSMVVVTQGASKRAQEAMKKARQEQ